MKSILTKLTTLGLALFLSQAVAAQTTGSFDTDVSFMSQTRKLSVYVPTTYNAATSYRLMICLHGLGDNSIDYRNALINSLKWNTNFTNTIFVCPDGGSDRNKDFYMPAGDEGIVQEAINYAKANYNIDASNIILQGFSLGGRSAFKYASTHPTDFKGLLLNTPAFQGVKDAIKPAPAGGLDYSAAKQLPVYITHGDQDIIYTSPIDSFYKNLVLNDYKTKLVRITGMAHNIPGFTNTPGLDTYFDSPIPTGTSAEVVEAMTDPYTCQSPVSPVVLVRNTAATPITSLNFQYKINSTTSTHQWTGTLAPYQHAIVTLPGIAPNTGSNTMEAAITFVNGVSNPIANAKPANDFVKHTTGAMLPITEGFEGTFPPAGWSLKPSGDIISAWVDDEETQKTGKKSLNAFNTIILFDNATMKEEIYSPMLDLSSIPDPLISFDLAFNYHKYTKPVWGIDSTFADTLEVLISTDCGDHYTSLYKKGGADLATFPTPITDPTSIPASYTVPKDENWRGERISLSSYAQSKNAIVMFRYISALGGCINIDNISFTNKALKVDNVIIDKPRLYPNPATSIVNVSAGSSITSVVVTDITGKKVMVAEGNNSNELSVNTSSLNDGLYLFQINMAQGSQVEKVMIKR